MAGISLSMSCPNCGGSVSVGEGARYASCQYCNAMLAIEGDDGVRSITFKSQVARPQAIEAVQRWWRGGFKARDLKRRGVVTESFPIYVPFWRLNARAAGWVCGYKTVQRNKRTERVPLEKMIVRDFDWSQVACDPGDIGIEHLRNFEGEAVLHAAGDIPTFEVTTSRSDAVAKGSQQVLSEAVSYTGVPHITFQDVHVFPKDLSVIFYPVWVIRYTYSERTYFATVDGVTGAVLSGRAPGDNLWRSLAMSAGMAIGGIGLPFCAYIPLVAGFSKETIIAAAIGAFVCLGAVGGAFGFFRYGSEMTTGDIKGGYSLFKSSSKSVTDENEIGGMVADLMVKVR